MKVSKVLGISAVILAAAILICVGGVHDHLQHGGKSFSSKIFIHCCDFRTRHAEILCAHRGVNSFHIWNRDVTLPGYWPIPRPDIPCADYHEGDLCVHAYPPWEVFFFYFLGWFPVGICLVLMCCLYVVCAFYIVRSSFLIGCKWGVYPYVVASASLLMIVKDAGRCFSCLNYSILCLALVILMFRFLDKGRPIIAAMCWALIMIKPQFGALFFWPLLFGRCYRTILTAVALCLGATVAMSFIYHESVLALILQVPQIGAPYVSFELVEKLFKPVLGRSANLVWMGIWCVVCGVWCFLLRKSGDFLVRCVPVAIIVPVWTYSQSYDHVILWIFYMVALKFVFSQPCKFWKWCFVGVISLSVFCMAWEFNIISTKLHFFDARGLGWIYYIAKYGKGILIAVLAVKSVSSEMPRNCLLFRPVDFGAMRLI